MRSCFQIINNWIHHCQSAIELMGCKVGADTMHRIPRSFLYPTPPLPSKTSTPYNHSRTPNQTHSCPHPVGCFYSITIWSGFDPGPNSPRLKIISHRLAIPAAQVTVYPCTLNYVAIRLCSVSTYVWSTYHVAQSSSICYTQNINQSKFSISDRLLLFEPHTCVSLITPQHHCARNPNLLH